MSTTGTRYADVVASLHRTGTLEIAKLITQNDKDGPTNQPTKCELGTFYHGTTKVRVLQLDVDMQLFIVLYLYINIHYATDASSGCNFDMIYKSYVETLVLVVGVRVIRESNTVPFCCSLKLTP